MRSFAIAKRLCAFHSSTNYLAEVPLAASVPVVFLAPLDEEFLPHHRREPFAVYLASRVKSGCVLIFCKIIDKVFHALGVVLLRARTDLRIVDVSRTTFWGRSASYGRGTRGGWYFLVKSRKGSLNSLFSVESKQIRTLRVPSYPGTQYFWGLKSGTKFEGCASNQRPCGGGADRILVKAIRTRVRPRRGTPVEQRSRGTPGLSRLDFLRSAGWELFYLLRMVARERCRIQTIVSYQIAN